MYSTHYNDSKNKDLSVFNTSQIELTAGERLVRTENNSLLKFPSNNRTTSLNIPGFAHDK